MHVGWFRQSDEVTTLSTLAFVDVSCNGRTPIAPGAWDVGQWDAEVAEVLRRHKTASQTLQVEDVVFEARDLLDNGLSG